MADLSMSISPRVVVEQHPLGTASASTLEYSIICKAKFVFQSVLSGFLARVLETLRHQSCKDRHLVDEQRSMRPRTRKLRG